MVSQSSVRLFVRLLVLSLICCASAAAQEHADGQTSAGGRRAGQALPGEVAAPLFFKIEWVRPPSQTGQVPMVQENVADPNVEVR